MKVTTGGGGGGGKREEWKPAFRLHVNLMDFLVELIRREPVYPARWLTPNMPWCDTRRGMKAMWYKSAGKRRMFFMNDLNIGDGMFHVPGSFISLKMKGWTSLPQGEKTDGEDTAPDLAPF